MKSMLDSPTEYVTQRGRHYWCGATRAKGGGSHTIMLALADQGTASAAHHATVLVEDFPGVDAVIMVGIAGGIPHISRPDRHVRLGDIVVSGEQGIIAYDFVKEHATRLEPRHPPRPPHPGLYKASRRLAAAVLEGRFPWLDHLTRAAHLPNSARPPLDTDRLAATDDPKVWIEHPLDPERDRLPGTPRVFIGTIACANRVLKNPVHRDQLRDDFDVRAVEMEGFGIADATWNQRIGYFVVRGICDYCDSRKNNEWQGYAAVIAAAYTRALLEEMPPFRSGSAVVRQARIEEAASPSLHKLAQALLLAGTPPSLLPLFADASSESRRALLELGHARRTVTTPDANPKLSSAIPELLVSDHIHHLIVASPGSGKTHVLWNSAQELLASGRQVPLFLAAGAAATWDDLLKDIYAAAPGIDIQAVFRAPRVCVLLDGWSEFASGQQPSERARALRALSNTRIIANGRRGQESDARFRVWNLDPLPASMVTRAIKIALPKVPPPPAALTELLRLPLALSLYILLGGSAVTRGELLTRFHDHLSRGFPESFRDVLAGAVASVSMSPPDRSRARLEHELQARAARSSLSEPKALLARLGTLESRGGVIVPVHDLYWSWLSGLGLLAEGQVHACLPNLSSRESIELALESGARPSEAMVSVALETDAVLGAQLSSTMDPHGRQKTSYENTLRAMLSNELLPVRCRGAIAALRSRSGTLLKMALSVLTEVRDAKLYVHALDTALNPEILYPYRGVLGEWIGSTGTDQLIDAIAERGDARWGAWLEQLANAGKLSISSAVCTALACEARIPAWTLPHLPTLITTNSYKLRPAASRGTNVELARWIATHYSEYAAGDSSTGFNLNDVLVGCDDATAFAHLLDQFPTMPPKARKLLCYAVVRRGDPWLSRFQQKAFEARLDSQHHYTLNKVASPEIDDSTARRWIVDGPTELGWRVLIARYGSSIIPEMLTHLPASFEKLHVIPALSAMRYLNNAPESLTDEIWQRVGGEMTPRAMQDVLVALSKARLTGIASIADILSRDPFFLPTYHLNLFLRLLGKWEADNHHSFRVQVDSRDYSLTEWLLLRRLARDRDDHFFIEAIQNARDLVIDIALTHYSNNEATSVKLLNIDGLAEGYHEGLFEYLVATPSRASLIPMVFSRAFDSFPEHVLLRLLDTPGVDLSTFLRALSTSSSPVHERFHGTVIARALNLTTNLFMYRDIAQIVRVHPREAVIRLLMNTITETTANSMWLVREIETARGELLINERGDWL
ncbi:5'-methylthioadenosine/S-adenosylhomocysteine nucleosidase family protein [Polyangium jinanense]|nr:hypothetical protein [Polyangium jinanense]